METDHSTNTMGSTCQTDRHYVHNVNLRDGDEHGYGDGEGDGTCIRALNMNVVLITVSASWRSASLPSSTGGMSGVAQQVAQNCVHL